MYNLPPTERFSSRVDNYLKYRPHYPSEMIPRLQIEINLTAQWVIADIGVGTGFSAELLLANRNKVIGVEPNDAMRNASVAYLAEYRQLYVPVKGTAEATTLPTNSVDMILAGQAFHWFDLEKTKTEWQRILKPSGWIALVWNERRGAGTPFLEAYERLLHNFAPEYQNVDHRHIDEGTLREFFQLSESQPSNNKAAPYRYFQLPYRQTLNWDGLVGRILSSSYVPLPGDPLLEPLLKQLAIDFSDHSDNGEIELQYDTKVYLGRFKVTNE
ncbi:MAG: class I SAM-dependent methyltransferase [bacterium]|nr:class I SAM-dependent methyltransferase [bacterium]